MFTQCLFCIFLFITSVFITISVKDNGPFNLKVTSVEKCKGPKRNNCSVITTQVRKDSSIIYDIRIPENVVIEKAKIVIAKEGQPITIMQLKKPCEHIFIGPIVTEIFNLSKDCVIEKGNHTYIVNIENITQKANGGIFFYGKYTFKYMFYNNNCNFQCEILHVDVNPKT